MWARIEGYLKDFQYPFGGVEAREAEAKVDQQEQSILPDFSDFPPELQAIFKEGDPSGKGINIFSNGKVYLGNPTDHHTYVKIVLKEPSEQATREFNSMVKRMNMIANEPGWHQLLAGYLGNYHAIDPHRGMGIWEEWYESDASHIPLDSADAAYLSRVHAGWKDSTGIARLRAVMNHSEEFELTEPVEKSPQEMLTAIRPVTLTRSPRVEKPVNLYAPLSRSAKAKKKRISD